MNWWIISIVAFVGIVLFKAKEIKHRIGLLVIAFFVIFLLLSIYQVYSTNSLDLTSFDGIVRAGQVYFVWLGTIFHNIGSVSTYVIQQDWSVNTTSVAGK